jgi:hypothetical protein
MLPSAIRAQSQTQGTDLQSQALTTRIVLTFSPQTEPVINGQLIPWKDLDKQLQAIYDRRPQKLLFVKAQPALDPKVLARVTQIAKKRGVTIQLLAPQAS